ncbi:hypothetical protein GQ37_022640 [Janthinobacterium sp. BJB1]|nr:hypothetical protein GQ37_022640 [Janthinobacterium sp. BJB1]
MPNDQSNVRRTKLNDNQIEALQRALDYKKRGTVIDLPAGKVYNGDIEILAKVGEVLTERFTDHVRPGGWPVRFVVIESRISNAYAYWMSSFEAICMTTSLAREIDSLCDDVASYLVGHHHERSGFAYIHDVGLSDEVKRASLKGLLIQGVMAFFVGHEAGHLLAGHKPVIIAAASAATAGDEDSEELEFVSDDFFTEASSTAAVAGLHSLRLNAHEIDADVQGFALTAAFWLDLHEVTRSDFKLSAETELVLAASSSPDRLLLLASTGAAIAMSLMGFAQLSGNWERQATHPLTAVRCVVGLAVLANRLAAQQQQKLTLQLQPECIEALSMVHSRLGSILLRAARSDGKYTDVARLLEDAPSNRRLGLMFEATGVAQAISKSDEVVRFLAEMSAEFNASASQRSTAIRVPMENLVEWTAIAP